MKDVFGQIKLVTVTREDLHPGYQLVQSGHAIAEFAHKHPQQFKHWVETSNYLISLSTQNEDHLKSLYEKLKWRDADIVAFTEPDIGDQLTSICYYGTPEMRKITDKLNLALS